MTEKQGGSDVRVRVQAKGTVDLCRHPVMPPPHTLCSSLLAGQLARHLARFPAFLPRCSLPAYQFAYLPATYLIALPP